VLPNALPIDAPSWSPQGATFSAMERCSFAGWECFRSFAARADSPAPGVEGTGEWGSADDERSDSIDLEAARAYFLLPAKLVHRLPRSRGEDAIGLRDRDILGEERFSFRNAPGSRDCVVGGAGTAARRTLGEATARIIIQGERIVPGQHVVAAHAGMIFRDGASGARQRVPSMRTASPNGNGRQSPHGAQPGAVWSAHAAGEPANRPRLATEYQGRHERRHCTAGSTPRPAAFRWKRQSQPKEEIGTP